MGSGFHKFYNLNFWYTDSSLVIEKRSFSGIVG
jgi:hypothetical protein